MIKADIFVSPDGNDNWSGRKASPDASGADGPVASFARARDLVREIKAAGPARDIVVLFRGGVYRIEQTVVFSLDDSAAAGKTITYAAYGDETPVFSAGVPIAGWRRLEGDLPGLPAQARGNVWMARAPKGLRLFRTLYDGPDRLPRARTAGLVPAVQYPKPAGPDDSIRMTMPFERGAMRAYENLKDAELVIRPMYPWVLNILPLESVDESECVAKTAVRATYPMGQVHHARVEPSAWVENVADGMLQMGNWMLDSARGVVYYWPVGDGPSEQIVAPGLVELVRIEGQIDYEGPADQPTRGLVFKGLVFTHGDRLPQQADKVGLGLQHDWEMFDSPTAMFRFRGAEQCTIEGCRFYNSGGSAVRGDLHCRQIRILDNVIEHIGGAGVLLAGYGPGTKDVNLDNIVSNNYIHHVGEIIWHSPAIFAWQSGHNRIAHNLIHNCPYTGIVVSGRISWNPTGKGDASRTVRWAELKRVFGAYQPPSFEWEYRQQFLHGRGNLVEYNDISYTNEILTDGNGIYISGAGGGNVVRGNFVHDNDSPHMAEGIRCDDDQHQTLIAGNVVYRTGGMGVGITSKGRNDIINNIIACPIEPKIQRGMISLEPHGPHDGSIIERNILYATSPYHEPYYESLNYRQNSDWKILDTCRLDHNIYYNTVDQQWGPRCLDKNHAKGIDTHSISADPMFVDLPRRDFRLKDDSPALKLGFEQIDVTKAGLMPAGTVNKPTFGVSKKAFGER